MRSVVVGNHASKGFKTQAKLVGFHPPHGRRSLRLVHLPLWVEMIVHVCKRLAGGIEELEFMNDVHRSPFQMGACEGRLEDTSSSFPGKAWFVECFIQSRVSLALGLSLVVKEQ